MLSEIQVTSADWKRIKDAYYSIPEKSEESEKSFDKLRRELERAVVVPSQRVDGNVITMNTRALLEIDGEEMEVSLVYPEDADLVAGKISIFSPIGTAILGYGEGSKIQWEVPSGLSQIYVKKVLYQPEAAGDYEAM